MGKSIIEKGKYNKSIVFTIDAFRDYVLSLNGYRRA